jgi:AcrR family transcriptional regulator
MMAPKSDIQLKVEADLRGEGIESDARRARIFAAAVQECSEKGYKNATMAGVAKRAIVSTATLYRLCKDKDELFLQSVAYLMPILAQSVTKDFGSQGPFLCIKSMLINHGVMLGDPFMDWLYRLYVSTGADESTTTLASLARAGRSTTEEHWRAQLSKLEALGYLRPSDHDVTINLLLGPVERRSILAQLLFGIDDEAKPSLEDVAHFGATALFANLGTPAYVDAYPNGST